MPHRFQAGYLHNGVNKLTDQIQYAGKIDGTRYHTLRLVIDNTSPHSVKVYLDGVKMGAFQEHFAPKLKGGVLTYHGYGNVGLFKNFEMSACRNFNEAGKCIDGGKFE